MHKWNGTELTGVAFFDPPLYVVTMNVVRFTFLAWLLLRGLALLHMLILSFLAQVKNFILLGDVHKSVYFLSWKEQGSQLSLLAKDFGSLDCMASEFLIDGSTLSLAVSDQQKNLQVSIPLIAFLVCT